MDVHDDAMQIVENLLLRENEQQEEIHRLTHQGMDEAEAGDIRLAEETFSQALVLAREHQYPSWEAQILYYAGHVFGRIGKLDMALMYAEQALALFAEYGPLHMEASVEVFLAHVYNKMGQPESAFSTFRHVLARIKTGIEAGQIPLRLLFDAYHELGHTYWAQARREEAVRVFGDALDLARSLHSSSDERTIVSDLIDLHLDTGEVTRAKALGEQALASTDISQPATFAFLATVSYNLGRAYAALSEWERALDQTQAAYAFLKRDRATSPPSPLRQAEASAFLGRILVNIGTSYHGLLYATRDTNFYPVAIAYWRMGEEYLARAEAEDVEVPRRNLRITRQFSASPASYQALLRSSEPLFLDLRAELEGTTLDVERESSIAQGKHTLVRKQYSEASKHFLHALQRDPFDLSPARHWHAYTRLFSCHEQKDLREIAECFEHDSQGTRDVAMASLLFAQWCKMAQFQTPTAYLDVVKKTFAQAIQDDPVDFLRALVHRLGSSSEADIYLVMLLYLRGENEECRQKLAEGCHMETSNRIMWCRDFWQAMVYATMGGQEDQARDLIRSALTRGMPPALLGPLRWLKAIDTNPTSFFMLNVRPLFLRYHLPYDESQDYPTSGPLSLPSQAVKIAPIRPGMRLIPPTSPELEDIFTIDLPGARGPIGPASLVFVEFDAVDDEEGRLLWPTTFAVRYSQTQGEIANRWQEYWIDYAPGSRQVTLVDRDFQKMTLPLDSVGRDYERGRYKYTGRGGQYWLAHNPGVIMEELGTVTKYEHLPCGMLAYLQELVNEALPHIEIFCESCHQHTQRTGNVWCAHIWWCKTCQHISSPVERSRRLMGTSPYYCPHHFPKTALHDPC